MDMSIFVIGYARSKKKGASSGDALKAGLLGSVVGAGNPALGVVASEKISERYVPKTPAVVVAKPRSTPGRTPPPPMPDWAKRVLDDIKGIKSDVKSVKNTVEKNSKSVSDLAGRVRTLEGHHAKKSAN